MKKNAYLLNMMLLLATSAVSAGNITNNINTSNTSYHQMYVLGDSLSDTGSFVGAGTDFVKNNWGLPHLSKIQLDSPYYKNRSFSNGEVAAEVLAKKLNFSLTPGWKFSALWGWLNYEQVGNNYATGGAVAADNSTWTGEFYSNRFNVTNQLSALLNHHKLQSNDLVLVETGNNDMLAALEKDKLADQMSIINNAVKATSDTVYNLIRSGVKHIVVTNVTDFGKVPQFYNTSKQTIAHNLSNIYNKQWNDAINQYQSLFPNIIKKYDFESAIGKFETRFKEKGGDVTRAAIESTKWTLGTSGKITTKYINGATSETLNNYFFLDEVHPTAQIHQWVGDDLFNLVKKW